MTWTPAHINTLTILWNAGKPASYISRVIQKSRNAVIGKARRLGLPGRASPIVTRPLPRKVLPSIEKKHKVTINKELSDYKRSKINKTFFGKPKTLSELQRHECRWPIGEDENVRFCGGHVQSGVYCPNHAKINKRKKYNAQN
jgi:GcrA cell cycle regulator